MLPAKILLDKHYKGDHWTGMFIGPILFDNAQPTNSLVACRMQFRDRKTDILGYELNTIAASGKGDINIIDAATWEILVPVQSLELDADTWCWDFECTDSEGNVLTLYKGLIIVVQDVTSGDYTLPESSIILDSDTIADSDVLVDTTIMGG